MSSNLPRFLAATLFLVLLVASRAQAVPVGWTVGVEGGFDGVTDPDGVAYLSPVETRNRSFDDVMASTFVVDLGFLPVTSVDPLMTAYGLPLSTTPDNNGNGSWDSGDAVSGIGEAARNFLLEFGATQDASGSGPDTFTLTRGYLASATTSQVTGRFDVALVVTNGTNRGLVRTSSSGVANDSSSEFIGFWLVRSPAAVPEPAPIALLSIAIGMLAACRVRR